jgi:hypothetical protein
MEKQWARELSDAVSASNSPWTVSSVGISPYSSSKWFAQLFNPQTEQHKEITLISELFQTPETRRAEILRQLSA